MKHHKKKELSKAFYTKIIMVFGIALVLFGLYSLIQTSSTSKIVDQKIIEAKEAARPAEIQMAIIQNPNCDDCFDIAPLVDSIRKLNVNITKEENLNLDSARAKELIDEYNIEKIPAVLLFGEINKTRIRDMDQRDNALVFIQLTPPYTNAKSNLVMGRVSSILLKDSSCNKCTDLSPFLDQLKQSGIKMVSERDVDGNSKEGKQLIERYSIEMLPTLILSDDLDVYSSDIVNSLNQIGSVEADGKYVTRLKVPPYLNLTTNSVVGLVTMTILTDESCNECYDGSTFHKPILQRLGVFIEEEKNVDISSQEGQALIEKYSIKKVPVLILEGDVEVYTVLVGAWTNVGTVESDGAYVFRKTELAQQPYKDLTTNEVVNPPIAQQTT